MNTTVNISNALPAPLPPREGFLALAGGLLLIMAASAHAGDWPQFRGPQGNSVASIGDFPANWDDERMITWKVPLPGRGPSSPIVVGGRVFVTCSSGIRQDRLHVLAFDAASGERLWERQMWATGRTMTHPQTANAAPTPASDGRNVFVFFSSSDLAAFDLDGRLLWLRALALDYPGTGNDVGMASSPAVFGDTLVVQSESQGNSFASGIDTANGAPRWRIEREKEAGWTSPIRLQNGPNQGTLLLQSAAQLTAHEPRSGRQLWSFAGACAGVSSAGASQGRVFVPTDALTALDLNPFGDGATVAWKSTALQPGAASTIASEGKLYVINRSGVLVVADAAGGDVLCRVRLSGSFWSTPVLAGKRLLAISFEGDGQLVELADDGRSGRVAAKVSFGEAMQSSPAVADGGIFVRSDKHLFKLAAPSQTEKAADAGQP